MSERNGRPAASPRQHALIALLWALFVAYGSLVPLDFSPRPDAWQAFMATPWLSLGVGSRADWVANILLYLVLAHFATGAVWASRLTTGLRVLLLAAVLVAILAMAVGIEYLQLFFPPRTVSRNDLLAEGLGTALGSALWFFAGDRLATMWQRFVSGGAHSLRAVLSLYALGYLALALFPYDFLVSGAELAAKLARPDSLALGPGLSCGAAFGCGVKLLSEAVLMIPFGLLLALGVRDRAAVRPPPGLLAGTLVGTLIGAALEAAQMVLASGTTQGISVLTRALGTAWGVALARGGAARLLSCAPGRILTAALVLTPLWLALVLALNGLLPLRLQAPWAALEKLETLRLLPFYYHYYSTETAAVRSLLFVAGSFAPIGVVTALAFPRYRFGAGVLAVVVAALVSVAIESLKLFTEGKHPDPTNLLIAPAAAWLTHWIASRILQHLHDRAAGPGQPRRPPAPAQTAVARRLRIVLVGVLPLALLLLTVALTVPLAPPAESVAQGVTYPPPAALPAPDLPAFRSAHPRLPHPTPTDLALLQAANPAYLAQLFNAAHSNPNAIHAIMQAAFIRPGTIELAPLHARLVATRFSDRGHAQVEPLVIAYDWLHEQWSPAQRDALRDKLAEGCDYLIEVIRKEQLSPYNAFLYNAPLQALMACSIALWHDHPRGEAHMRFTHELWKNRVLPVWRQVFGRNGGWHEGGEYVAVGIGQAIHALPAMWRAATGEDLFASEPGLRGFLDFLVYRTRPDRTQMRWGDGAWFDRAPRDLAPLALEYGHAAAYTLAPPGGPRGRDRKPAGPLPTGWPWGPLSDERLIDANAAARLPLARLFDGIGLLVARSDWSDEATWVSFKAGDNFWSHSHLDQGAFTIFKGGPLAIDSGWYGPAYGSEHHMNYAYQSIAHNLVTVTDPADNQPGPGFDVATPRHYANDGGQRRIGSGWGVDAAPLDVEQWQQRRATHHTGRIAAHLAEDGLAVAVADITAAYTSAQSGRGSFADRTRRVERMWRVFGYDHVNDAVVVFDDVVATQAEFRKRWLLHSIDAPVLGTDRFELFIPATGRPGRSGGRLHGHVLLPRQPLLHSIGGPGFEFFVDGRNYDEEGRAQAAIARLGHGRAEPGAWRLELIPAREARADQFLVVMLPTPTAAAPAARVTRLEDGERVGAEIVGAQRTTRWWFTPGRLGVRVEVEEGAARRGHTLNDG
jgi:VanZ family protein